MRPDQYTFASMIACYKNCGQWSRALEMTHDMQVAGVRFNSHTYSSLISAAERGGQVRASPQGIGWPYGSTHKVGLSLGWG